jgi:hypothetical protein
MALKSAEATIDFLLLCLEHNPGKTDWEEVARKSGWYKSGKFSYVASPCDYNMMADHKPDDRP